MPGAPRPKGKATKIAYAILGKPLNMRQKRNKSQQEINRRLVSEETWRVR